MLQQQVHNLSLMPQYLDAIRMKKKCIEGRINHGKAAKIMPGDFICFCANDDDTDVIMRQVKCVKAYSSFKDMLDDCGFKNCIPSANTLDEAVEVYNAIPGYKERVEQHGCIAIYIKRYLWF